MTVSPRVRAWGLGAILLGLLWLCYRPALNGGLVWDDAAHVTTPDLQLWTGLARIWTEPGATQQYYPVLHSAFWIEHRLWGNATVGYHLANLLEDAADCWLFALLLSRLSRERGISVGAAIAALLFAVHPVCVESVAWISEQKNTLSLLFYLCAGLAYLSYYDGRDGRHYIAAFICFTLAVGTKTVTATFPAAALVVLWWRDGEIRWRREGGALVPFFVLGIAAGWFTAWVERHFIGASGADYSLSFWQRCLLAGRIIGFYVHKLAWPSPVIFVYPRWNVPADAGSWYGWLLGAVALTAALWALRRRSRGPLAAWLFFVGSLFPALGFFNVYPFRFSYVADHFQYLAALGAFAVVGLGLALALQKTSAALRLPLGIAVAVVLTVLGLSARRASAAYRDSETLYRTTLALNPDCWMAHNNLGAALSARGETAEAIAQCRAAIRLKPDYPEAHNNLGKALLAAGSSEAEAQAEFRAALQAQPRFPEARLNLANLLAQNPGTVQEALDQYGNVLREVPNFAEAHFCYANTLARLPVSPDIALREYAAALRLRPDFAEAHANRAGLLAQQRGGLAEAEQEYQAAIRLAPDEAPTHYGFGVALDRMPGRAADARKEYETAIRLNPRYAPAYNNLAVLDAKSGDFAAARQNWQAALRADPRFESARQNLRLLDEKSAGH